MVRWRPLAIVLLVAVLLTALGGLALAGNKYGTAKASKSKEVAVKVKQEVRHGKQEVRLVKERGDDDDRDEHREKVAEKRAPVKKAPAPRSRTVVGVLVNDHNGFVLVATGGEYAFRVVAREGLDLAPYAWKRVQARLEARDGQWVVVAVKKVKDVRFVVAPQPKAKKPEPQPAPQPHPEPQPQPEPQPAPAPSALKRVS